MKQFGIIFKYELRKLVLNGTNLAAFIIMIVTALISGVFEVKSAIQSSYDYFRKESSIQSKF